MINSILRLIINSKKLSCKPSFLSFCSSNSKSSTLKDFNDQSLNSENLNNLKQTIEMNISKNPIMVFSKSFCPYCTRSKEFLRYKLDGNNDTNSKDSFSEKVKVWELDLDSNGEKIQSILTETLNKSRITVPQIFINSKHIGGCDDLLSLEKKGKLDDLLKQL